MMIGPPISLAQPDEPPATKQVSRTLNTTQNNTYCSYCQTPRDTDTKKLDSDEDSDSEDPEVWCMI